MQRHKSMMKREIVEAHLLQSPHIKPFEPEKDYSIIQRHRNGNFGFSACASALYANGYNERGESANRFGLLYHDGESAFFIGYFRKEGDPKESDGYLMVIAPTGQCATEKVNAIIEPVLEDNHIPCQGAYIRFLDEASLPSYREIGFHPVSAEFQPWHPRAPLEDETYAHSFLDLSKVIELTPDGFRVLRLKEPQHKSHAEKSRMHFNRFSNFLERNGFAQFFSMERLRASESNSLQQIIRLHFDQLNDRVGSVPEDHLGIASPAILSLSDVYAYASRIDGKLVSILIGEKIGPALVGLYTPFSLRKAEVVLRHLLGLDPKELVPQLLHIACQKGQKPMVPREEGITGIAIYSQLCYFAKLLRHGITHVKLGGSEMKGLDDQKRQLGAEPDPTYWAVKLR